ncbi:MAG: aldolase/citrate lyase family protein [Verrucomicrobiota bacterium]
MRVASDGTANPPNGTLPIAPIDPGRPWGWAVKAALEHPDEKLYNRAKAKLLDGKQVFGHSITHLDVDSYCRLAPHYDLTWFDIQYGLMTFADIQRMLEACPRAGAAPMLRLPDAREGDIQRALDIGILGIVVPSVDDAAKARQAAIGTRFPPVARRGSGDTIGGPAALQWGPLAPPGSNYRRSINDNTLVIAMIESVEAVNNALEIASTPGIDVLFMGNKDLQEFSGFPRADDRFQDLLIQTRNAAYQAGKFWGNVLGDRNKLWPDSRFNEHGPTVDGWVDPLRKTR